MYVRKAEEKDIPAILGLLRQVNEVHYEGRPDLFKNNTKYDAEGVKKLISDENTPLFVCEDEGKVAGYAICMFKETRGDSLLQDVKTLYIDDICVDGNARRRGVGSALYEYVCDFAKKSGCYNLTLNVWACNPAAMKFYVKCGLVPLKTTMEKIL
ncbi:MAG TPA: GNAT family N-acetyltransferase [Candidatus Coproplasma excrementavium]|nr:GNAT family N-acetyltransferase [Candidatus Coproplasma excrementavium]